MVQGIHTRTTGTGIVFRRAGLRGLFGRANRGSNVSN
jgi:hypothetical protein